MYIHICVYTHTICKHINISKHTTSVEQRGKKSWSSFRMRLLHYFFTYIFISLLFYFCSHFLSLLLYITTILSPYGPQAYMKSRKLPHYPFLFPTLRKTAYSSSPTPLLHAYFKCSRTGISTESREQSVRKLQKGALTCLWACFLVVLPPYLICFTLLPSK